MKLTTLFISKTKQTYAQTLTIPKNTFKIKVMLAWILLKILIGSNLQTKIFAQK